MPPSNPTKQYSLPRTLAAYVSGLWSRPDHTAHVQTAKPRPAAKELGHADKLDALIGTIIVDEDVFTGRTVLLIDDLYQSGVTMNYCALMLLRAGAARVYGLACEKTCRNDDNVPRRP